MEKKIKVQDVIDFIKKSMEKNYTVKLWNNKYVEVIRKIKDTNGEYYYRTQQFGYLGDNEMLRINLSRPWFDSSADYIIDTKDKREILKWETFIEDIKEYYYKQIEEEFNNFFKEREEKHSSIDDLDDDD